MTTITKLICPECRYENEAERVYCHGCGARLCKPVAEAAKNEEAQTIETRERLRRMMDNRGVKARQWATNIAKLLLGSCIAAALIQIFLPPDLPAPTGKEMLLGPQIGLELENALFQHRGAQVTYREDQVNSYLGTVLKRKKVSLLDKPMLDFERGSRAVRRRHVSDDAGTLLFRPFDLHIRVLSRECTKRKNRGHERGRRVGRMPIHPQLMQYAGFLFSDAWKAMEQDRKQVEKFAAIEFHPQTVVLTAPVR